ncbi:MAG: NADH-quinone oxidoreductase subunit NuoF [Bryobacteraceae bacterium]
MFSSQPPLFSVPPHPKETIVLSRRFRFPNSASIDTSLANDGYQAVRKALEMTQDDIINEVKASNLRGRGGAGFPTGMKWGFVPRTSPKPKYIVVNADESEPGTCKDRLLLEYDPHSLIEGMIIAGRAIDAKKGYIYIRGEYRYLIHIVDRAIEEAYQHGYLGRNILGSGMDFDVYTHTGAGAYECGEESALLESLEGKRGVPRIRPPFPAVSGAWQCPTILNNVETFCAVPHILLMGGKAFADLGLEKAGGTKLTCLTGHLNRPGVYELRLGFPVDEMIHDVGGGIPGGRKLKAFIPGGSSCPVLTAKECEGATMDYDSMAKRGSMLGSGGVVVMDEKTDMVRVALRIMRFYQHESCGWCIPCREGTTWLRKMLQRFDEGLGRRHEIEMIGELAKNMLGRTFCPLGDAAALPTISIVEKFADEFEKKLGELTTVAGPFPVLNDAPRAGAAH